MVSFEAIMPAGQEFASKYGECHLLLNSEFRNIHWSRYFLSNFIRKAWEQKTDHIAFCDG